MFSRNKKIVTIIAHLATWACFFALPFLVFFPRLMDSQFTMSDHLIATIVCNNIYLVLFYYFNTLFLIPKFLMNERWMIYIVSIIVALFIFLSLPKYFADLIAKPEIRPFFNPNNFNGNGGKPRPGRRATIDTYNAAIFLLVFTVGTCIAVIHRWLIAEEKRKEVASQKINTELSFLKSQINPHFFFNTLNNIYSLAIVRSEKTAPAVMKLSSIMRYILAETTNNLVPLQKEVDFIKDYIELQKVRLTDKTSVSFDTFGNIENKMVAPLIFIPFIENAFKYGISTKYDTNIEIKLEVSEMKIIFDVCNNIFPSENMMQENTGIGMNNVKRRLELMYPNKHTLSHSIKNNHYFVHLEI